MRPQLQYIADTILVESLLQDNDVKIALGQESSTGSSIMGSLKSYVSSIFNPEKPIASLTALFANGLLFSLGGWKIKALVLLASAFGFDWQGFWGSVGKGITDFVKELLTSHRKATAEETSSRVNDVVSKAANASFTGSVDEKKVQEISEKLAMSNNNQIIKTAGGKSGIAKVLIKIVGWVAITVIGMIGLSEISKMFSGKDDKGSQQNQQEDTAQSTGKLIKISPNAPQELFSLHRNNMSSIWIEHGEISDIEDILKSWIFSAYPQLQKYTKLLESSSGFQSMVANFNDRNKLANGLNMISIPRPYQRKIDIVAMIVGKFLREAKSISGNQQNQSQPKIQGTPGARVIPA